MIDKVYAPITNCNFNNITIDGGKNDNVGIISGLESGSIVQNIKLNKIKMSYVLQNPKPPQKSYFLWKEKYRIPHDTILHDEEGHKLTKEEWLLFLNNMDKLPEGIRGNKNPRFNGKPLKYMLEIENQYFGAVIEYFTGTTLPIIATVFKDSKGAIEYWYKK